MRAEPITAAEVNLRWLLLPAIVLLTIFLNKIFSTPAPTDWSRNFSRSLAALAIAYVPAVIVSEFLDVYFFADLTLEDAFLRYLRNPYFFLIQVAALAFTGAITSIFILAAAQVVQSITRRFGSLR